MKWSWSDPTTDDSRAGTLPGKRGPGMHHICLEVDDIDGMLAQLKGKGIQLINEQARQGEDGRRYTFIHPEISLSV